MLNDILIGYIYSFSYDHEGTDLLPENSVIEGGENWKIREIEFGFVYDTTPGINWSRSVQIEWVSSLNNIEDSAVEGIITRDTGPHTEFDVSTPAGRLTKIEGNFLQYSVYAPSTLRLTETIVNADPPIDLTFKDAPDALLEGQPTFGLYAPVGYHII